MTVKDKCCVVIPAYNEGQRIGEVLDGILESTGAEDVTIFVVDDGSADDTAEEVRKREVSYIKHKENQGKGRALRSGFAASFKHQAEYIITLDADGQHEPSRWLALLNKARDGNFDIVIGSRMANAQGMPIHRKLSNRITSKLISWRLHQRIEDSQCGYRLYRAAFLKELTLRCRYFDLESEILLQSGAARIGFVPIDARYGGESSHMRFIDVFRFIKVFFKSFLD